MSDIVDTRAGATKVLVVEDEFFIADELRRKLTAAGLQVLGPVSSNERALDLLEQDRPDVAVLDVHLGEARVTAVAAKLRQLNVPIVLATACPAHELASDPVLAGAVIKSPLISVFSSKPFAGRSSDCSQGCNLSAEVSLGKIRQSAVLEKRPVWLAP